jgi:ribosomal protein S18 acetylase RimI-like enzyme
MALEIREVKTEKELKQFVKFPFQLYKKIPQWVPPLISDELETFNPAKNPFLKTAESRLFMAWQDNRPVGRIAAILSHASNEKYQTKNMRFGWFETVDDYAVAEALWDTVRDWAREKGMETMTGPHGFSNFDHQGMLIQGFELPGTIFAIYNPAYYPQFAERYGFSKEVDYVEIMSRAPENGLDERYARIRERIEKRTNIRILRFKDRKEAMQRGQEIFDLLNEAYVEIYGVIPLAQEHKDYLVKKFISFVVVDLINGVVDENDQLIGFLITMPSLGPAFQKAKGRLLPFGWYHILKGLKTRQRLDFLLIGVKEEFRRNGVPIMMLADLAQRAIDMGVVESESSPMLENNILVQSLHKYFPSEIHKRRRIYKKQLYK